MNKIVCVFVSSHSFRCEHPICLRKIVDVFVQHCIDFDFQEVCIYGSSCQKSWCDGCWFSFLGGEDWSFFFRAGFSAESIRALHLFVAIALCSLWWSRSWRGKTPRLSEGMRDGRVIMTNPHLIHQSSRIINEKIESHEKWSLFDFWSFYVLFDFRVFFTKSTKPMWFDVIRSDQVPRKRETPGLFTLALESLERELLFGYNAWREELEQRVQSRGNVEMPRGMPRVSISH